MPVTPEQQAAIDEVWQCATELDRAIRECEAKGIRTKVVRETVLQDIRGEIVSTKCVFTEYVLPTPVQERIKTRKEGRDKEGLFS